ncbi:MAG: UTRA domain-containing protein, partial [Atopobium sp.]|nr:UTRA domain-containing protein [Atopobium sp.]
YQDIRHRIEVGEWPYQAYLPSEAALVEEYSCSHNTLRRALAILTDMGYLQPKHGKGVRVIYQPHERALFEIGGIETFKETAQRNHLATTTTVESFEEVVVDDSLSDRTGFMPGSKVYQLVRVRHLDGQALILDKNWFLASVARSLTPQIAASSIYEYLEGRLGVVISTSKRTISVERTCREDERLLDIDGFDFLAVVTSQTFDDQGTMFEFTQSRHRPDYFTFHETAQRHPRG